MTLDLKNLHSKYKLNINGVIHIGANKGEEYNLYKILNIKNMVFVEPRPDEFNNLKNKINDSNCIFIQKALGNKIGIEKMYISYGGGSPGASSSILKPKLHLDLHKKIKFHDSLLEVEMEKLDNLSIDFKKYNFINIDVQGYELEVFKGGKECLSKIDYIYSEVNRDEVYENCTHINELDIYLKTFGFERVETNWCGNLWGDAFYIKKL